MEKRLIQLGMLVSALFWFSCQSTDISGNESFICGTGSKDWIVDKVVENGKVLTQRKEQTVTFYCDGSYQAQGRIRDHWELEKDGKTLRTVVLSRITHTEFSSEVIALDDEHFVFRTIDGSDTTMNYLIKKLPTTMGLAQ